MSVSAQQWLEANPAPRGRQRLAFEARGSITDYWRTHAPEIMLSGPAGTGKTRGILERLHVLCGDKYPGMKALICRKTGRSLSTSVLDTYQNHVLHPKDHVYFHGGSYNKPAAFHYPNGSMIVVGGLDDVGKLMSTEYDQIYINEAFEATEEDWEKLSARLRNFVMPYQQIQGDTNPQGPSHWIKRRADRYDPSHPEAGGLLMLYCAHEENPMLFQDGQLTNYGQAYMGRLDGLTGVTYQRLRKGLWVAAEGAVYEFDRQTHMVDHYDPETRTVYNGHTEAGDPIPFASIRRILGVMDFGFEAPGVLQLWGIDTEKRLFLLREVYAAHRTFSKFWTPKAKEYRQAFKFERILGDPSGAGQIADLRAAGVPAQGAENDITLGIQQVTMRLQDHSLFVCRDALEERDDYLYEAGLPIATEQEFDSYVWPKGVDGKPVKEVPVDENNHGLDCARYMCLFVKLARTPMAFVQDTEAYRKLQEEIATGDHGRRRL